MAKMDRDKINNSEPIPLRIAHKLPVLEDLIGTSK